MSTKATDSRLAQAKRPCRALSLDACCHSQYRIGCFEKWFSLPPMMCRQEWQPKVYAARSNTLTTMIGVRSPTANPPPKLNAKTASKPRKNKMTTAESHQWGGVLGGGGGNRRSPL